MGLSWIDWLVMLLTLFGIVGYGAWKNRSSKSVKDYLLGERDLKWWTIGLSVMATQASAITFLSTPGQAYQEGMGFAQFYFGLPVAMVILSVFFLPIFYKLKVYTAYEYLEQRFDVRARVLTASLFLVQRGMAAGIVIYAPAIILSSILGWELTWTMLGMGVLVISYTVIGGASAVSRTQQQQMIIILLGMFLAFMVALYRLPEGIHFNDALGIAGKMGKLEVVDFTFDLSNKYTFWSGMLGGVFLFLSYFGTDQSQVQRYLSGKSLTESRLGLLFNGLFKVPMQFAVLLVGIMVFIFFQFEQPPLHFNQSNVQELVGEERLAFAKNEERYEALFDLKKTAIHSLVEANRLEDQSDIESAKTNIQSLLKESEELRKESKALILKSNPAAKIEDSDYVFIYFVIKYLPIGLVGLLLAVIFSAAMSTTASELNALATTTTMDMYKRLWNPEATDAHYLKASKLFTVLWGAIALSFAWFASLFDNLIEAVNIVGSVFYGAILGIFLVAFFFKKIGASAAFWGTIIGELLVITIFILDKNGLVSIAYLWLNLIGCFLVILISWILQKMNRCSS